MIISSFDMLFKVTPHVCESLDYKYRESFGEI